MRHLNRPGNTDSSVDMQFRSLWAVETGLDFKVSHYGSPEMIAQSCISEYPRRGLCSKPCVAKVCNLGDFANKASHKGTVTRHYDIQDQRRTFDSLKIETVMMQFTISLPSSLHTRQLSTQLWSLSIFSTMTATLCPLYGHSTRCLRPMICCCCVGRCRTNLRRWWHFGKVSLRLQLVQEAKRSISV